MRSILFLLLLCSVALPVAAAEKARIAVASNFTSTMQQLVRQFEQQTGYRVITSYGSTGKLFAQITNGAPFDAFLAADSARPRRLEGLGLIADGRRFTYAKGELALWSPQATSADHLLRMLREGDFRYLAIANPKTAPYGYAAEQLLDKLGLAGRYAKRTAKGENIAQTYQFIYSGNAQLGFVARAQLNDAGTDLPGAVWPVPTDMYTPIEQQAVLLKRGEVSTAARAFMDFLRSEQALAMIAESGYGISSSQLADRDGRY